MLLTGPAGLDAGRRRGVGHHHVHGVPAARRAGAARRARRCWSRTGGGCGSPRPGGGSPTTRSRSWRPSRRPGATSTRDAEPAGTLRIAGFATADPPFAACRRCRSCAARHPRLRVLIAEHEPEEALDAARARTDVDLALVYDFTSPRCGVFDDRVEATPLWTARVGPRRARRRPGPGGRRGRDDRALPRPRLDRQLPQRRRRAGGAPPWPSLAGFTPAVAPPLRQPGAAPGHDRRRARRRAAPRRTARPAPACGYSRCAAPTCVLRAHAVVAPRSTPTGRRSPSCCGSCGIRPGRTASWRAPRRRARRRSAGPRAGRCRPSTRRGCTGAPRRPRAARA